MVNSYPFVVYSSSGADEKMQIARLFPKAYTHQHTFFEFVYVLQGSAVRQMPDAQVTVSAGDYYVIDPLSAHGYTDIQKFRTIGCLFHPEFIDRALSDCPSLLLLLSNRILRFGIPMDLPISNQVFHDADGSVRRIVQQMEREYTEHATGYMEMLRCYLTQLLVCAVRACDTRSPHNAVTKVVEYLKFHYAEPLSLATLSALVGYTPQYLSNLFHNEIGINIQTFLQRLRVEEASKLLTSTDLTITEIAAAVGYQDMRHFSRLFRQYQQLSPKEFRKAANSKNHSVLSKGHMP